MTNQLEEMISVRYDYLKFKADMTVSTDVWYDRLRWLEKQPGYDTLERFSEVNVPLNPPTEDS